MEAKVEGAIDAGLESISAQLYRFSVGAGCVLLIMGVFLLFRNRGREKKSRVNMGWICIAVGAIAMISGFMQM